MFRLIAPILALPFIVVATATTSISIAQTTHPFCQQSDSDSDGDGWGWEHSQSCRVPTHFTTNCVDPDGDGYGWDGTKTCLINSASTSPNNSSATYHCIDTDGDGYGWNGTQTCLVTPAATADASVCVDPDGDGFGWDGSQTCSAQPTVGVADTTTPLSNDYMCEDPDGDGFGWDGTKTCLVSPSTTAETSICVDPDGDGFGWDGTQTCSAQPTVTMTGSSTSQATDYVCDDPDGDGFGWDGAQTCTVTYTIQQGDISGVTDVILMMGQSNALGENTQVDLNQDSPDSRTIVWTQFDDWQTGNLCTQMWQKAWFPWRGGICSNHPAFQIAKHIVERDPARKVAVIPTGTAGKPIRWWDANGIADQLVNATVQTALASLGRPTVDLIAWSQGEADHGNEVEWFLKLNDLISRLRQRPWFDANSGQFIAQETKKSSINLKVRELGSDGDPLTDWVPASDQPTKDGVHWSGSALRTISDRIATKYVY